MAIRALLPFRKAGPIRLKPGAGLAASVRDEGKNPKKLPIVEPCAPRMPVLAPLSGRLICHEAFSALVERVAPKLWRGGLQDVLWSR